MATTQGFHHLFIGNHRDKCDDEDLGIHSRGYSGGLAAESCFSWEITNQQKSTENQLLKTMCNIRTFH